MRAPALSFLLVCAGQACAGDWTVTPRFTMGETYTDNVLLVESGAEGDFVTSVTPGISLRGKSARLESSIDYNLQQLLYGDKSRLNATNHQMQSLVEAILVEDWLYFDTNSRMSQQAVDNRGQITRNSRGGDANRDDVTSYEWSPRIEHHFGGWASTTLRYYDQTVDRSGNEEVTTVFGPGGGGSDSHGYDFRVAGGPRFGRIPLTVSTQSRTVNNDTGTRNKFKSITGEGSYIWSRSFRFNATGGKENNDFSSNSGSTDGPFWTIGGTWTPSPRTTIDASWGDRFFGKTFSIDASHRHRRWIVTYSYNEDVQTTNQFQQDLVLVPLFDPFGAPVFDPVTSSQIYVPLDSPTLTDDVYVQKRSNASVSYMMQRTNVNVTYFESDRTYQSGGNDEKTHGVSLNISRTIRPRLHADFGATWRENKSSLDESKGTYYSIYPSLNYELGPHTTARLQYEYSRNDGGESTGGSGFSSTLFGFGNTNFASEYVENAITATLVFHL